MNKKIIACLITLCGLIATPAFAKPMAEIDKDVNAALTDCYEEVKGSQDIIKKAAGVLVFPEVTKGGLVVGLESGKGALLEQGKVIDYYQTSSASLGATVGVQKKSMVIAFMNKSELEKFKKSSGWKVGVDGSVAVAKTGASGELDSNMMKEDMVAFVYGEKGLMLDASVDGSKISKLEEE